MPKGIWAYNWVHRSSTFASYYYEINGSTTCKFSLARVQSTCQVVRKRYTAIRLYFYRSVAAIYTVANLCQSISTIQFLEDERSEGRSVSNHFLSVLCQHIGVAPEEGAYLRDKMSDPAYKPPLHQP